MINRWSRPVSPAQRGAVEVDESVPAGAIEDGDELWSTGRAAEELRVVGIGRRRVSRLVDSGELVGVQSGSGSWRWVKASSVRRYKARMLAKLAETPEARTDPT